MGGFAPDPDPGSPCGAARAAILEAVSESSLPPGVVQHLQVCPACRGEAASLTHLVARLRALPLPEPPATFWATLPQWVAAEARARRRHPGWALTGLAAAAALVLAVIPADHQRRGPGSPRGWLSEVAATDSWLDPLLRARSPEEVHRVADRVALVAGFGPGAVRQMAWIVEEAAIRRPETPAWTLLDTLSPTDLDRVLAKLEKGAVLR